MRARTRRATLAATLAAATLALAPATALANPFTDIADSLNDWLIETLLAPVIDGLFQAAVTLVSQVNAQTLLTSPFRSLFGSGTAIWALADGARNAVVMPIAHSLLALAMLVQLVRVSERVDGSATMPAVREVAQLAVFFTIFPRIPLSFVWKGTDCMEQSITCINCCIYCYCCSGYIITSSSNCTYSCAFC